MRRRLAQIATDLARRPDVRAVVLAGARGRPLSPRPPAPGVPPAPPGTALDAALELARSIAERPGLAIRAIKRAVDGGLEEGPERGEELERELIAPLFGSYDAREGVTAFRERRPPRFEHR